MLKEDDEGKEYWSLMEKVYARIVKNNCMDEFRVALNKETKLDPPLEV